MRRALILSVAVASALGAGQAMAQQYLGWSGKPATAAHPAATAAAAPGHPDVIGRTVAPAPQRPAAALPPTPSQPRPGPGLTPASAWLAPYAAASHAVAYAPSPAPASVAVAVAPMPMRDAPAPRGVQPPRAAPVPAAPVAVQPAPQPLQPVAAAPVPSVADDPMAPRRDAPIFRVTQPQGQPQPESPAQAQAPTAATTAAQGAAPAQGNRYYSVHRQAGRQPDPVAMPQPIYLDALPVELTQTPGARDLAEPGAPPTLLRGADGRVQAMTPATDGDLP